MYIRFSDVVSDIWWSFCEAEEFLYILNSAKYEATPGGHFTKFKNFEYTRFCNVQTTPSGHSTKLNHCTPLKKVPKFLRLKKLKCSSILLGFIGNEYF